jgi:hypothetical protein
MNGARWGITVLVALVGFSLSDRAGAQEEGKKQPAAIDQLTLQQGAVADKYSKLEKLLDDMARIEGVSNPQRAALLMQALRQSKDRLTTVKLNSVVKLLSQEQLNRALENQREAHGDMRAMLELLLSENRSDRLKREQDRVREYIKEVERIIRLQKSVQGRTEGGGDPSDLSKDQEKVAGRTGDLAQTIRENEEGGRQGQGQGEGQPGEGQPGEGQPGEGQARRRPARRRPGPAKARPGEGQPGEGQPGEGQGPVKANPVKARPGEGKPGEGKPGEGQTRRRQGPAKANPAKANPAKANPAKANPAKANPAKASPAKARARRRSTRRRSTRRRSARRRSTRRRPTRRSRPGQPGQGQGQGQGGEGGGQQQQQEENPARKRIEAAEERMREAQRRLEEAKRKDAVEEQEKAREELEAAKAELEKILRQLREEEIERMLAMLEGRFRKMLEIQIRIYEDTIRLDRVPEDEKDVRVPIPAGKLATEERKLVVEADKALNLLLEEGSSIAFPETVSQMRDDMQQVSRSVWTRPTWGD